MASPPELAARHPDVKHPSIAGCIENMDDAAGRILKKLNALGEADNTLVIFTSDNGRNTALTVPTTEISKDAKPNSGKVSAPRIIRWPDRIKPAYAGCSRWACRSRPAPVRGRVRYPRMSHSMAQAYCLYLPPVNLSPKLLYWFYNFRAQSVSFAMATGVCHDPKINHAKTCFWNGSRRHQEDRF